ncbi:MAG: NAD(P)H-hydrate dehydratase [Myxococcales bacterium]|nr:NAD(P)H-hydrate dehydratase [Myxococcales bacterium]
MRLVTPEQVQELDRRTIKKLGLPAAVLMETAGRGVVRAACERIGSDGKGRLATVICGNGNNGGDGFVIARQLLQQGFRVHTYGVGDPDKLSEAAQLHYGALLACGAKPRWSNEAPKGGELKALHRSLLRSVVIVDALIGVGATKPLREPALTWIQQLDGRHEGTVVSVDIPSGLHAGNGRSLGAVVKADLVVCMVAAKTGLFLTDGPGHWRELAVVDIGVPPSWVAQTKPPVRTLEDADLDILLPAPDESGYKGSFGHLLVVAGSAGKGGAALLTAKAGLRAGAGLLTLATSGEIRARIEGLLPDIMVEAVRGGAAEAARVAKLVADKSAVAIGPGLGTNAADLDLVARVVGQATGTVIMDADALRALARKPELANSAKGRLVLTPHPGEMARLVDLEVAQVQADRLGAARKAAEKYAAVVVLKGARTLVVAPDGRYAIRNAPNAALAVAGSGDVLTGVIAAVAAQGVAPYKAACAGVILHSKAGSAVRDQRGPRGSIASDIVEALAMPA